MPASVLPQITWGEDGSAPTADQIAAELYRDLLAECSPVENDEQMIAMARECAHQAYLLADALVRERNARLQREVLN